MTKAQMANGSLAEKMWSRRRVESTYNDIWKLAI
jgi:hypothetical protein